MKNLFLLVLCAVVWVPNPVRSDAAEAPDILVPIDVFQLEFVSDPRISPDGEHIVYVRNFMDIMTDRARSNLWIVRFDGTDHRPLTTGTANDLSPRWSPDGTRLLYVSRTQDGNQIFVRWMDSGQTAQVTRVTNAPASVAWSPDGDWIAFSMMVSETAPPLARMPSKPKGAEWADPPRVIRKLQYRFDGAGYLRDGYAQLFVLPAHGGTPRQVTHGAFHHRGPISWSADGRALVFSANRHDDWEYDPLNSEVYEVSLESGEIKVLTDRAGPDANPTVSPDGSRIAYTGFDDKIQGYQVMRLYVMNGDGSDVRAMMNDLDRSVRNPTWSRDGRGIYFQYDDHGDTKIGYVSLRGKRRTLAEHVGGTFLGRPYASGSFTVARSGRFAYTRTNPQRPADVGVGLAGKSAVRRVTTLNEDLLGHKRLGPVEEITFVSSYDGRRIQGWVVKPPDFDASRSYPLILEIHGGPFANYGDRFSAEIQLYAAAGYVVLYVNPRGSTSYGEVFGNLIHHNYPGQDYDDLMSGVDRMIDSGYVDEDNLFVTGGSGGGVLSSWIVGKTDRFRAAVVAKPVINWYSFALTSDLYAVFYKYWFPGYPWDYPEEYLRRSPISLVGHVNTPTMLLTGEADYRTPISESEQFYQALKLRKVDAALVRIPGASHGITRRPSNLITKVTHILAWFGKYRVDADGTAVGGTATKSP